MPNPAAICASAQVGESDEGALVGRELAAAVTLAGDDKHRDPLRMVVVREDWV